MIRKMYAVLTIVALCATLSAQRASDIPKATNAYVLQGATVVAAPGRVIDNAVIVIENGLIRSVGPNVVAPVHARIVECDSMYVYAGFIEGIGHTGIEQPRQERSAEGGSGQQRGTAPDVRDPGNPPNDVAGITPEIRVRDILKADDKTIADMRKLGFTIAHTVPRGRMLPGRGSLILLGEGETDALLLREDISLYAQLQGAPRVYPATVIGVMAKWRELYRQAELAKKHQAAFDRGAHIERPRYDRATEAMIPVTEKTLPVYFRAPSSLDISRVYTLQKDLDFKLVLAEARQAWYWTDRIKGNGTPVLISLHLPEDKNAKEDKVKDRPAEKEQKEAQTETDPGSEKEATSEKSDTTGAEAQKEKDKKPEDPEIKAFEERRRASLKEHYGQAAALAESGIPFAFSTLDAKPNDIHPNIRKMIAHGLSEDHALAALTTQPAQLLGISAIAGTIDAGKLANLVVTTKPLFDEETQIRYVFVEGVMYEYDIKAQRARAGEGTEVVNVLGTWAYTVEVPGQTITGRVHFSGDSRNPDGYMISDDNPNRSDLRDVRVSGNRLTFESEFSDGGNAIPLYFDLDVSDGYFTGEVSVGQFGSYTFQGRRLPD